MNRAWIWGILISAFCAHAAHADSLFPPFEPVADFAPPAIVFDQPAGEYDKWVKDLPCGANRASVVLKFDKSPDDPKWEPIAKITLNPLKKGQEEYPDHQMVSATIRAHWGVWRPMVLVERYIDGKGKGRGWAPAFLDRPWQIDLAWTPDGVVNINFGGQYPIRMPISKPITSIGVTVSSAKFEFLDLKVGHAGPPATCENIH